LTQHKGLDVAHGAEITDDAIVTGSEERRRIMPNRVTSSLVVLVILLSGISQSQEHGSAQRESRPQAPSPIATITASELRDHVFYLASDFLEGRLPGSEGFKYASYYVASQLAVSGFVPDADDSESRKYYYQNLDFTISTIAPESGLHVKQGRTEAQWTFGEQFFPLIHNQLFDGGLLAADAVFVGFGIEKPELGWNDYASRDVLGKIAIIFIGTPIQNGQPVLPEVENERYAGLMQSIMIRMMSAFNHNAAGVIIIPDSQTSAAWPMLARQMNSPARRLKPYVGNDDARQFPVFLLHPEAAAELFKETDFDPVSGKGNVQSTHLDHVSLTFDLKYLIEDDFVCSNVIGFLPGSDPDLKDEYVVVSSHLDHLGMSEQDAFNGANDNASGCAAVMEAAEALIMSPQKRSIFFLFSTGEERAGHGSLHFINNFPFSLERIKLVVNVDMVGRNSPEHPDAVLGVTPDNLKVKLAEFVESANASIANVSLRTSVNGEDFGDYYGSGDEAMFAMGGIPAVLITSGFGWPEYHQTGDDAELIDFDRVADASRLVFAVTTLAANGEIPNWKGE
jgi:hypothetical protein